ncbi:MAG: hypothetical protein H2038_08270 [Brevundimonas sp.]|jgi:hypothetical protein|uniref:hypothetical protein n=1 Tax=Brevundimonas sp. TaxID=1871086 RepID=UPI0017B375E3|nr:hypothetical protein [Brevundimonas sp.]MBA4804627.1 hypothetical protein [Brevundimonas sp.]
MADVQSLSQFTLSETPDGYLIEIEGDGGGSIAVEATPEQLDAIIDALDDLLSEDEAAADEVDSDGPDEEEDDDEVVDDVVRDDES